MRKINSLLTALLATISLSIVCIPQVNAGSSGPSTYGKTKYPIVLVHGFAGFESILGILDYWYGIPAYLQAEGADVHVVTVSPFNSTAFRGEELIRAIENIRAATGAAKVNLIGHSHGGPTIRYAASVRPDLVASVTTVAGANFGANIADYFIDQLHWDQKTEGELANSLFNFFGNVLTNLDGTIHEMNAMAAVKDLTSAKLAVFNAAHPGGVPTTYCGQGQNVDANGMRYYSWSGRSDIDIYGSHINHVTTFFDPTDALFLASGTLYSTPSDGLVTTCSSHLGMVIRDDYYFNHLDIVNGLMGLHSELIGATNPKQVYKDHANRLKNAGI